MKKMLLLTAAAVMTLGAAAQTVENPELSVKIGDYDNLKDNGTIDECYTGSYYDRVPTTFYMKHTGSEIIYTKEDLAELAGDSITGITFLGYNEGLFEQPSRTVNIYVKEISDDSFTDPTTLASSFFDYTDGVKALSDYAYSDDDFLSYCYMSYELNLPFDKPVYYSGDKNLLVVVTFDGDEEFGQSLDFSFYADQTRPAKAMAYNNDDVSFEDYQLTDDWPGRTDETTYPLETPVTKITYKKTEEPSPVDGIDAVKGASESHAASVYDLMGRKVLDNANGFATLPQGVYVVNGKKVVKK